MIQILLTYNNIEPNNCNTNFAIVNTNFALNLN